jgi:hypothetical protein
VLGTATVAPTAGLAVLALCLCVAWYSMLRRDFTWADPAVLTWSDTTDGRIRTLGRRLWAGWAARFAVVGYLTGVTVVVLGPTGWLPAGGALAGAVAVLAAVLARRAPGRWELRLEYAGGAVTLVLAGFAAGSGAGVPALWLLAGLALGIAAAAVVGSGPVGRPAVAVAADRTELVRGYLRRTVRQVTVAFGDALALLPPARPLPWPWLLAGRAVVARFVLAGVLARARSALLAVLCVVGIAVLHQVFPLVSPLWLVGAGAYLAGVPFAASLAQLWSVPGLRRWLACRDVTLRLTAAAVVACVAAAVVGLVVLLAVPVTVAAWLAVPLAVGAAIRTVTRRQLDYGNVGLAVAPAGYVLPVGLIVQLAHGPDLLVIGLLVVGSGLALAALVPLVFGMAAYGVTR